MQEITIKGHGPSINQNEKEILPIVNKDVDVSETNNPFNITDKQSKINLIMLVNYYQISRFNTYYFYLIGKNRYFS